LRRTARNISNKIVTPLILVLLRSNQPPLGMQMGKIRSRVLASKHGSSVPWTTEYLHVCVQCGPLNSDAQGPDVAISSVFLFVCV
jgi:hypothetical protein